MFCEWTASRAAGQRLEDVIRRQWPAPSTHNPPTQGRRAPLYLPRHLGPTPSATLRPAHLGKQSFLPPPRPPSPPPALLGQISCPLFFNDFGTRKLSDLLPPQNDSHTGWLVELQSDTLVTCWRVEMTVTHLGLPAFWQTIDSLAVFLTSGWTLSLKIGPASATANDLEIIQISRFRKSLHQ